MRFRWRRPLVLSAALVGSFLPWLLGSLTEPEPGWLLGSAHFGETIEDEPTLERVLPHRWQADCSDCRTVWYRFDITLDQPPRETQALYMAAIGQNAAVYLNGQLLGAGGRFSDPAARLGQRSLLLAAPGSQWAVGENRLYVLVKSERPRLGYMPAPALSGEEQLRPLQRWRTRLVVTVPQVLATAAAMLGLVMAVLWSYRRHYHEYALLSAATLAWAVYTFVEMVVEPPWPTPWWDSLRMATLMLAAALILALTARLAEGAGQDSRSRRWLPAIAIAVAFAAATAWEPQGLGLEIAQALASAALVAAGLIMVAAGWQRDASRLLVPGAMLTVLAAPGLLPGAVETPVLALPIAAVVLFASAGWTLLVRFVETLNAVELLNVDLEGMVRARTEELAAQFDRVRELERREAISTERERLMRDMHDGVGGNLVSLLAMIEADGSRPGELASFVRDALDDMRLMIDSLEPADDDLNVVLAMWRDRLVPRMRIARVTLHWDVELLPPVHGLTPARVLHVLRLLQEAVTNAIRHGHARELWLTARGDDPQSPAVVHISLRDDGSGFDPAVVATGRGLRNMRRRAAETGAQLCIDSQPGGGTTVSLTLPAG